MIRQFLCFALVYSAKRLLSLDVSDKLAACCVVLVSNSVFLYLDGSILVKALDCYGGV